YISPISTQQRGARSETLEEELTENKRTLTTHKTIRLNCDIKNGFSLTMSLLSI
ncbi:hypothetical protein OUZ56_026554, partial [Daphnia magna]